MNNQYGVDVDYFRSKLEMVVRDLNLYTPEELGRELAKFSLVAFDDESKLTVDKENTMIYLHGKDNPSFKCECRCNVFHTFIEEPNRYYCNSCDAEYIGED